MLAESSITIVSCRTGLGLFMLSVYLTTATICSNLFCFCFSLQLTNHSHHIIYHAYDTRPYLLDERSKKKKASEPNLPFPFLPSLPPSLPPFPLPRSNPTHFSRDLLLMRVPSRFSFFSFLLPHEYRTTLHAVLYYDTSFTACSLYGPDFHQLEWRIIFSLLLFPFFFPFFSSFPFKPAI